MKVKVKLKSLSCVRLFATLWTVAHQASPSMGFSRQESGVDYHFLLQGIFLTQESNLGLPHCRQMLYPLSYHRDSISERVTIKKRNILTCTHMVQKGDLCPLSVKRKQTSNLLYLLMHMIFIWL